MIQDELKEHIEWLQHEDIQAYSESEHAKVPWFPAYKNEKRQNFSLTWFSALVPVQLVPKFVQTDVSWDISLGDGGPSVWTTYGKGEELNRVYTPFGNQDGIEPLVLYRTFHGIREKYLEVSQEFRLYHNLFQEESRNRFIVFDRDGNESEAIRYGTNFVEIRTDLLLSFCSVKQSALAVYVDSSRFSKLTLEKMGVEETRSRFSGESFIYHLAVVPAEFVFDKESKTIGHLIGKKYIFPEPYDQKEEPAEKFHEFIIGTDEYGNPNRHTCDPEQLANFFGKNPEAPNYLTPVFFRADVLSKYYADSQKYSVEDGHLRCAGLWGLGMDNDHADYVVVRLGSANSPRIAL